MFLRETCSWINAVGLAWLRSSNLDWNQVNKGRTKIGESLFSLKFSLIFSGEASKALGPTVPSGDRENVCLNGFCNYRLENNS